MLTEFRFPGLPIARQVVRFLALPAVLSRVRWLALPLALCGSLLALTACENSAGISFGQNLEDDAALSVRVREAFAASPLTANQGILVSTRDNNFVRISGVVDTDSIRGSAEQIARRVEGVNGVINTLHVE